MGRVAREVLDGLPSRASAGSTLCARCSTGVAAVGPRLGDDGDLDLCGDRSLPLSRRVSAALAYTPRSAVLAAPRNTCLSSADGRIRGNGVRESCSQDEAEGGVGGRNQSAALLAASAAPEAAALSCDCTPCDKTTPEVSTDARRC